MKIVILIIFLIAIKEVHGQIQISNCSSLQNMRQNLEGSYVLMENINCSGYAFNPIGNSSNPFKGILNGNGYTIKCLSIEGGSNDQVGLFGYTNGSVISNTVFQDFNVSGSTSTGLVVGYGINLQIINVTLTSSGGTNRVRGTCLFKNFSNLNNLDILFFLLLYKVQWEEFADMQNRCRWRTVLYKIRTSKEP